MWFEIAELKAWVVGGVSPAPLVLGLPEAVSTLLYIYEGEIMWGQRKQCDMTHDLLNQKSSYW